MENRNFIDSSFKVFVRYPKLILPIFFSWIVFFSISIASLAFIKWDIRKITDFIYPLFVYYIFFAFMISIACSMLLEMIQQIENGESPSFFKSLWVTLNEDLNDMIPVIFLWALLWAGITLIEIIVSRRENYSSRNRNYNADELDDVRKAVELINGNVEIGFSVFFFETLKRGIRMTAMMSFCAVAWDNLGYYDSLKKAFRVIHSDFYEFASGFLTTGLVLVVIFIPPVVALWMQTNGTIHMQPRNYFFMAAYTLCALSYAIYMEQLFMGQLYMWHKKWEKAAKKAIESGQQPPEIEEIPAPSILDDINDLKKDE